MRLSFLQSPFQQLHHVLVGVVVALFILSLLILPISLQWLLLCLGVFLLSAWLTPLSALIVLLTIAPLRTLFLTESTIQLPLEMGQLTLLFLLFSWLTYTIVRHKNTIPFRFSKIYIPFALFIVVTGFSVFYAYSFSTALVEWIKWLTILFMALFTVTLIGLCHIKWVIFALVSAALANAIIGIYIFFGGSGALHLLIGGRFFRAFGTFGQPNPFGGFMGLIAPFALVMMIVYGLRWLKVKHFTDLLWLFFYAITLACLCFALFASWSRGAWLGFIFALLVMAFSFPRKLQHSLMISGALIATLGLLWFLNLIPQSIATRIQSSTQEFFAFEDMRGIDITAENYAVAERLAHWQAALNMAQDNPFGVGLGNYEVVYDQYRLLNWKFPLGHAHNFYLNLLAEVGALGLISYLFFIMFTAYLAWKSRQSPDTMTRLLSIAVLGALAYLIFHSLLDNLYVNNLFLHVGVIVGIVYSMYSRTHFGTYMELACRK